MGKLHPCQKPSQANDLDSFTDLKAPLRPNALLLQGITDVRVRTRILGAGTQGGGDGTHFKGKSRGKEQPLGVMSLREEGRGQRLTLMKWGWN